MTSSNEMEQIVEAEMAEIEEEDFLRPGCAFDDYEEEYTRLLGQAEVDCEILTASGFKYNELMPKYRVYQEKLAVEQGARVVSEGEGSEAADAFSKGMPKAEEDKKRLMAMGRFVVSRSKSPEAKKIYDFVRKGSGHVDTLNDNIAMVGFARRYADLASEVRPGGKAIDEPYLEQVRRDALALLELHGQAKSSRDETSRRVERKNQLITLCILAEREIKRYADAAFYDDTDRYSRDYANRARRAASNDKDTAEESAGETSAEMS